MARPRPDSLAVAALLTALVAFGPISTDMYLPSLPAMTRHFGVDVSRVQLTLSVFVLGFALCQLVYGPVSDRFGRRPVLLAGIAVFIAASVFCAFAPTIETLILGRFFQAFGACAGPVLGRAVVRDVYPPALAARVMSYMASAMALMPAVAPLFGGWIFTWFGWQANFVALAVFGALLLALTGRMLDETNHHRDHASLKPWRIVGNYARIVGNRRFLGNTLTMAFGFAALFAFISGSSFVLIDVLGVPATAFGYAFAFVAGGFATGTFLSGRLGPRFGARRMIAAGVTLSVVAALTMAGLAAAGLQTVAAVMVPQVFLAVSAGLIIPNGTAAAIAPFPTMAGTASAMLGFLQMACGAVSGYVVGRLHDGTTLPMALVIAASALACLAAHLLTPRHD